MSKKADEIEKFWKKVSDYVTFIELKRLKLYIIHKRKKKIKEDKENKKMEKQ